VISSFRGKYRFLSNFYPHPQHFGFNIYPSLENVFQLMKTRDQEKWKEFEDIPPAEAKRLGQTLVLREDWEEKKLTIMEVLLRAKFANATLKKKLLATGDEELVEGNNWGDTFWGQVDGVGENHLGKLLVKIRKELRDDNV
jgi:hypothetical protein